MTLGSLRDSDSSSGVWHRLPRWLALLALVILPFRVVSVGFRPPDDALRHAAKAVSGKDWSEILVLRPEATVDPHPGFHALLGTIHRVTGAQPTGLVILSAVALGLLFLLIPVAIGRDPPEAWLLSLLVVALCGWGFFFRLMDGRPFDFTLSAYLALLVLWPGLRAGRVVGPAWLAVAAGVALSTWIHGNWYLWALPVAGFILAGETRVAARAGLAVASGVALGALATGRPIAFVVQTLQHPLWALGSGLPAGSLVGELRPGDGTPVMILAFACMVLWRHLRERPLPPMLRDPLIVISAMEWALGFLVMRAWWDWGVPALLVWMMREFSDGLQTARLEARSRATLAAVAGAVLVLAVTSDYQRRWSITERSTYLHGAVAAHGDWLPDPGGILYSNSMKVFFDTFFRNPFAPWRYMLGFEPALMPREDFEIFRRVQGAAASDQSVAPWVAKMRAEDRLVLERITPEKPQIDALEWFSPYRGMWIGRLRRRPAESESKRSRPPAEVPPESSSGLAPHRSAEGEAGR